MLLAGFSCKPWSHAGKRLGFDDLQNGDHVKHLFRILKAKQPIALLWENVQGLVNHSGGHAFQFILDELDKAGYDVFYQIIPSFDHELHKNPTRLYIVGFRKDLGINYFDFPLGKKTSKVIEDLFKNDYPTGDYWHKEFTSEKFSLRRKRIINVTKLWNGQNGVFIKQTSRFDELTCKEDFAKYISMDIMPYIQQHYAGTNDPTQTVISGKSLGGVMATFMGLKYSDIFGKIISQAGMYQWSPNDFHLEKRNDGETGWLMKQFVHSPRLDLEFYLDCGIFEATSMPNYNKDDRVIVSGNLVFVRHMRDVLQAKGYKVTYQEFLGSHEGIWWDDLIVDGLIALIGNKS